METSVLDSIRENDPDLAQKIMDKMFTFEDMLKLDNKAIQMVLKEVTSDTLVIALKGASSDLKQKVLANMSSRASEALKEDMETRGPVRLSEVESQQKDILKVVRRLVDEGQIVLGGDSEDALI
jgi:flagellar motor switch protein FliG